MIATLTAWFLTYLLHSTILLAAAWLISRALGDEHLGFQEALLRTALVGGIVTAGLQVGLGFTPLAGAFPINPTRGPDTVAAVSVAEGEGDAATDTAMTPVPTTPNRLTTSWAAALLTLWFVGSLIALLALGRSALDLRRLLQTRQFQPAGRLIERLAAVMGLARKIRFSTSAAIAVPFATGISRPEICCPDRVHDLAIEHRTALFAHELAHLARRDPAWQLFYRVGEAVFFLQPLNRVVRRRLGEIAEHLTDERAVSCTGNRLGLARCLVVIAHWGTASPLGVPAAAFAAGPRLDRRVRRLISGNAVDHRCAPWTVPLVVTLVLGFTVVLPLFAPTTVHADRARIDTADAAARTWSLATVDQDADEPAAPEPPPASAAIEEPPPAPPAVETAPRPETPPTPEAPPETSPVPSSAPAPAVAPASVTPPQPAVPPEPAPSQNEGAVDEARHRQRAAARERSDEAARARELARAAAREAARQDQDIRARCEDLRQRVIAMRAEAESEHREKQRAARELSRVLAEEARATARETAARIGRLTDEQREELRLRTSQLLEEARVRSDSAAREARERARVLSEEARALAEEAELQRRAAEERKRQRENE